MAYMEHASGGSSCNLAKVVEGASAVWHGSDLRRAGS